MKVHGNVRGRVRVSFLALFASKPHSFMWCALKLFRIVRANVRLNSAIPSLFWLPIIQKPGDHPNFRKKRSRSEKAISGALGEFRGLLGAALGTRSSILGVRPSTLGMASHDLSNTKTTILGATPGVIPGIHGNPHRERFSFAPAFSERFFKNWAGPIFHTGNHENHGNH